MYSAAAYRDLERLRGFVEREGGGGGASLAAPDGNRYHALQWAALNNYPKRRSLHHRGPAALLHGRHVNAGDNAQQTAQHWAAVRRAIAAAKQEMNGGGEVEYWEEWVTVFGFRNELPDPSFKLKWLPLNKDKDQYKELLVYSPFSQIDFFRCLLYW
ncbi:hypothetical protein OsI_38272 [Oryza sativa Indica Group]|uniref:Uncharacterized protein n=1 Tax=Oryza sativa subsp. indica TaxID=39946 RepID=B8BPJ9_ORYSI|nr:hypothetical protein OsI_38272 [Oryza sativa Indica Group]